MLHNPQLASQMTLNTAEYMSVYRDTAQHAAEVAESDEFRSGHSAKQCEALGVAVRAESAVSRIEVAQAGGRGAPCPAAMATCAPS